MVASISQSQLAQLGRDLDHSKGIGKTGSEVSTGATEGGTEGAHSFSSMLQNGLQDVNQQMQQASQASTNLAVGKTDNIHETMLSLSKAELSFEMLVQVRNKMLDSYKEVMNMQV